MNAVGIDVSKGKRAGAIMRPFGEVVAEPFEVSHTDTELRKLVCFPEKRGLLFQTSGKTSLYHLVFKQKTSACNTGVSEKQMSSSP